MTAASSSPLTEDGFHLILSGEVWNGVQQQLDGLQREKASVTAAAEQDKEATIGIITTLMKKMQANTDANAALQAQITQLSEGQKNIVNQNAHFERECQELRKINQRIEAELETMKVRFDESERERRELNQQVRDLIREKADLEGKIEEFEGDSLQKDLEIASLESRIKKATELDDEKEALIAELREQIEQLKQDKEVLEDENGELNDRVTELSQANVTLKQEVARVGRQQEALQKQLQQEKALRQKLSDQIQELEEKIRQVPAHNTKVREKLLELLQVNLQDAEATKKWLLALATQLKLSPTVKRQLVAHIEKNAQDLKKEMDKIKKEAQSQDSSFLKKMVVGYGVSGWVIGLALAAI